MLSRRTEADTGADGVQLRLTLHTRQRTRTLILPPIALAILVGLLPLVGLLFLGATCYFIFHDDLLAGLTQRQVVMQYSYEDRLAQLRHEIINLTQHAKINEAELAERLSALTRRQGQLESRTVLVASLAQRVKALRGSPVAEAAAVAPAKAELSTSTNPLLSGDFAAELPPATSAYAPIESPATRSVPDQRLVPELGELKPHPEGFELRLDNTAGSLEPHRPAISPLSFDLDRDLPLTAKFDRLAANQERLDHAQLAQLTELQKPAKRISGRLRAAFRSAGLTADQLSLPANEANAGGGAVGGPFVPLAATSPDSAAFARAATDAQSVIAAAEKLRLIATHVPLAAPMPGPLEVTSPFGPRIDPFLGRPALHTGVDLREEYGAPIRATADGKVVFASAEGGYGNMVEIDHGNGLSTRYAHLSSFAVRPGQKVKAGTIVGRVGETGRATGPHLHYETRIDGQPVNPERFLRAGLLLRTASTGSDL